MEKISYNFPKSEKLCGEIRIANLFREGNAQIAYPLRACWRLLPCAASTLAQPLEATESACPRIKVMLSAPKKKLHRANKRNRAKRLMREAYRRQKQTLWERVETCKSQQGEPLYMELAIVWLAEECLPYDMVYERMGRLLQKIQEQLP